MPLQNKYYTPKITNFSIGDSCEIKEGKSWIPTVIQSGRHLDHIQGLLFDKKVRVKLFDKVDIEELGMNITFSSKHYYEFQNKEVTFKYNPHGNYLEVVIEESEDFYKDTLFQGTVYNINDFVRLLDMLGLPL
jgi:hypothetical protein